MQRVRGAAVASQAVRPPVRGSLGCDSLSTAIALAPTLRCRNSRASTPTWNRANPGRSPKVQRGISPDRNLAKSALRPGM